MGCQIYYFFNLYLKREQLSSLFAYLTDSKEKIHHSLVWTYAFFYFLSVSYKQAYFIAIFKEILLSNLVCIVFLNV